LRQEFEGVERVQIEKKPVPPCPRSDPLILPPKWRIGVNAVFQASGGSLTNLVQLISQWERAGVFAAHDVTFYLSRPTTERLQQFLPATVEKVVLAGADGGPAIRVFVEQVLLPRWIRRHDLDVLYCPGNTMPLRARVPCVVTFQNAAPFSPAITIPSVGGFRWARFQLLGLFMRWSAARAQHVIFGSQHFHDLFRQRIPLALERTSVIYRTATARSPARSEAPQPELEEKYGIRRPYLLSVSHLQPYKNITELIEGYDLARRRGPLADVQLVLVGGMNGGVRYAQRISATLGRLGLTPRQVLLTGDVPHAEVRPLLAGSDAFVFSSACENCPTGLVEALSMGLPVACSQMSSMPEVADDAVLYFDPYDPTDVARALTELFATPGLKRVLAERAAKRARQLPNEAEMARQTLQAILSVPQAGRLSRAA